MQVAYRVLPLCSVLSRVSALFSLTMLVPAAVAWIGQDAGLKPFILALGTTFFASLLLITLTARFRRELSIRDGFGLVVGLWSLLPAVATVPLLYYLPELSFTDAYFEAMSGLTTTGATALAGLDQLPASINLWRHLLNWLGGMGIIVLAVAILPMLGVGGMQLFKAETPGPVKDAKLTPRIHATARNLWLIYAALTALCTISLYLAGMNWLDASCHAMAALSLGGFSTHDASVGFFNSPLIELILIIFMLLAAINFATHYLVISKRKLSMYRQDSEFKSMLLVIFISIVLCAAYLFWQKTYPDFLTALRHVAFNLVSIATDSGFASVDFAQWPIFVPLLMLLLSCCTACAGSTGGGIKMMRTIVLCREAGRQLTTLLHPNAIRLLHINGSVVSGELIFSVLGFVFLYVASLILLTFVLMASGLDFLSSLTAIIACINNAGPGLGVVGPASNFGVLSDFQTWVCSFAMLLGRLEVFSVLVLFTPAFWKA
jgi:trk system potassium uptake protein TrkH